MSEQKYHISTKKFVSSSAYESSVSTINVHNSTYHNPTSSFAAGMDSRGGGLLRKALSLLFGSAPIFRRLLHGPTSLQRDLESQPTARQPATPNYGTTDSQHRGSDGLLAFEPESFEGSGYDWSRQSLDQRGFSDACLQRPSEDMEMNLESPQVGPVDDPSRVVVYNDGSVQSLALLISKEMVFNTQEVIDYMHQIQTYTDLLEEVENEVLACERMIEEASANLQITDDFDEAQKLQEGIESHKSMLRSALERQDAFISDLKASKLNLDFAKSSSHSFLKKLLDEANLLATPRQICEPDSKQDARVQDSPLPTNRIPDTTSEGRLEYAAQEAMRLYTELGDAQREFDSLENEWDIANHDYEECVANGNAPMTRSDFDLGYLQSCRETTQHLIETEEAYKEARSHALATGAISSDFGEPELGGFWGEWEEQSEPVDEYATRMALRDYSFVEVWLATIPDLNDEIVLEPPDIDEWDARPIEIDEDRDVDEWDAESVCVGESQSGFAEVDGYREKIDFWKRQCAHLSEWQPSHDATDMQ